MTGVCFLSNKIFDFFSSFSDPPDISVEKSWIHSGEGFEAQLVCIVHADPSPTVCTSTLYESVGMGFFFLSFCLFVL